MNEFECRSERRGPISDGLDGISMMDDLGMDSSVWETSFPPLADDPLVPFIYTIARAADKRKAEGISGNDLDRIRQCCHF